jgi:hypothetical protein
MGDIVFAARGSYNEVRVPADLVGVGWPDVLVNGGLADDRAPRGPGVFRGPMALVGGVA